MRFAALIAVFILGGCAATGDVFSRDTHAKAAPRVAAVTVYRKPLFIGDGSSMKMIIDGVEGCKIPVNGFQTVMLPPGVHKVELRQGPSRMAFKTIQVKGGQRYYYRVGLNGAMSAATMIPILGTAALLSAQGSEKEEEQFNSIRPVDEEQALAELTDVKQALDCAVEEKEKENKL